MMTKIFIIIMCVIYGLFFLSVFGPMHSEKKFWKAIYRIQSGMDCFSRWFYGICAIATVLYIIYFALKGTLM